MCHPGCVHSSCTAGKCLDSVRRVPDDRFLLILTRIEFHTVGRTMDECETKGRDFNVDKRFSLHKRGLQDKHTGTKRQEQLQMDRRIANSFSIFDIHGYFASMALHGLAPNFIYSEDVCTVRGHSESIA